MKTIDESRLQELIKRLVQMLKPQKIYLYGSHAYGSPHQDSDIDLLIVVASSDLPPYKRSQIACRTLRGLFFPADLKVVTQGEFERRRLWLSSIERVAAERGKVIYAAG